jgi:hypothetical protein
VLLNVGGEDPDLELQFCYYNYSPLSILRRRASTRPVVFVLQTLLVQASRQQLGFRDGARSQRTHLVGDATHYPVEKSLEVLKVDLGVFPWEQMRISAC